MAAPQQPGTRISWTPRQREVLDLLVGGLTNGEIAERLGITLDGAKFHVSEILNKLGATSREEAAAYWLANRPTPARRLLAALATAITLRYAAIALGALTVVSLATLLILAAQDSDTPSTPNPTTTEPATGTPESSPTPSPNLPPGPALEQASGAFTVSNYQSGDTITDQPAAIFIDIRTGETEVVRLTAGSGSNDVRLSSSTDRWVTAAGPEVALLFDRDTGRQLRWDAQQFALVEATDELLIFGPGWLASGRPEFYLLDDQLNELASFQLNQPTTGPMFSASAQLSPTAQRLLVTVTPYGFRPGTPSWALVEVPSGTILYQSDAGPTAPPGYRLSAFGLTRVDDDGFLVESRFVTTAQNSFEHQVSFHRYDWDGRLQGEVQSGSLANVSPDGRFVLANDTVAIDDCLSPGACTSFRAVRLVDVETGETVFRLKGATNGIFAAVGNWYADSQAFITVVGGLQQGLGFLRVGIDGSIQRLDYESEDWFGKPFPSPYDLDTIAFGYGAVRSPFGVFGVRIEAWPNSDQGPWGPDPNTLRIIVPPIGRDGAYVPLFPNPILERETFDNTVRLRAASLQGQCLNVRARPGLSSAVLDCVPEGTLLTATPALLEPYPEQPGMFFAGYADELLWLHVTTPSGISGWVSPDYLDWAP